MTIPRCFPRVCALIWLGLWTAAIGLGQAEPSPANVTVSFTVMVLGNQPVTDLFFLAGGKLTPFKAPSYQRSTVYHYSGPATMTFYRLAPKDGVQQPEAAGQTELPTGATRVLVLLVPAGGNYSMGAVDDGEGLLPLGKVRLYNATPNPLTVVCNDTPAVTLKPFETVTADATKEGAFGVNVSKLKDGQWQPVFNSVYRVPADQKINLFMLNSYSKSFFKGEVQVFLLKEGNVPPPRTPAKRGPTNGTGAGGAGG
jgi:hypothetical protein